MIHIPQSYLTAAVASPSFGGGLSENHGVWSGTDSGGQCQGDAVPKSFLLQNSTLKMPVSSRPLPTEL